MSSIDPAVPTNAPATPASATASPGSPATPPKKKRSPLLALLSIVLAIVGGALIAWSFLAGITIQLDRNTVHNSIYIALFFLGLGIVIVGIIFALVGIIRRVHLNVSVVGLVLSMLPSLIVLVIAALLFL